jgi:hypothetical protein
LELTRPRGGSLPAAFCWTRFGTEAGETIESILARKEAERRRNGGVFMWGIGNAVGNGIRALLDETSNPEVLFSPIRGRPRPVDVTPQHVVEWQTGEAMEGHLFPLPPKFHVRGGSSSETLTARYALVCESREPLRVSHHGQLRLEELRNLVSGNPVGASQVTSVVRRVAVSGEAASYPIAIRARLVAPYFIRLRDPVPTLRR